MRGGRSLKRMTGSTLTLMLMLMLALGLSPVLVRAELRLPKIFGDHMVLQRDTPLQIWGWADPGSQVTLTLGKNVASTRADGAGKWSTTIPPMSAGGPYRLSVMAQDTLILEDILVGEVWICSGQSNMGMTVGGSSRVHDYKTEIKNAKYPNMRILTVDRAMAALPLNDVETAGWFPVSPETIENFSATAYFFGRQLLGELGDVPIGLIHTSWGGTKLEAWTSASTLERLGLFKEELTAVAASSSERDQRILDAYRNADEDWRKQVDAEAGDLEPEALAELTRVHPEWDRMDIPNYLENTAAYRDYDGIMWFQRLVVLPAAWLGKELFLSLGTVDDFDRSYLNGVQVGSNNSRSRPSEYVIPATVSKTGANMLSVRVTDVNRRGGIWGRPRDLFLTPVSGGDTLWLQGSWSFQPILDWQSRELTPPENPYLHNRPTVLYNAMLAPLMPLAMRGVIWYQGEANASQAHLYRRTFPAMIHDWRQAWGRGDFPFLYVQLANFGPRQEKPGENAWAELRDAQLQTLALPHTSMAVIIDIGDERDIHPKNKQEVGRRLGLLALANVYGRSDLLAQGPELTGKQVRRNRMTLSFSSCGRGLTTADGGQPKGFALAGEDGVFYWAIAKIKGNRVILTAPEVQRPVAVRYGWAANPDCNLINTVGLPASPFKTDDWPDITERGR